ncbi:inositol monophosphatase family protein [Actinomadura citrea]|uniref:inositol-phosphate phosphatase n=1 Tax=Actinomadura citrea TaxID=46158 RepID=A0A7Y9GDQ6_9ACTN|nr:inositol monophosphatase family protein [Actinomadura citrea]NYE14627.1 myo-inositol-1(or 4)-monophosphatase [Actinomadura citrea]GGT84000.1 inositol phosphatase [Actinomadura citrea]
MSVDVPASRELAGIAELAARATGDRLRTAFRSRPEVDLKRDFHDPVTEHDRAAEETIREVLAEHAPGSAVVGEEGGVGGGDGDLRWFVDPIDGTANFAVGLPFFCVSIGAAVGDELVAGVVYDPVRDDMFTATLDGATCNGEPIRSRGATRDETAVLVTGYPNAREMHRRGEESLRRFGSLVNAFATVRRPGSAALTLAHVAAGWADVAYGTSVNAWDVAAAVLLVRQAGGTYLPLNGEPGGHDWEAPGYLACVGGFDLDGSVIADVAGLVNAGEPA